MLFIVCLLLIGAALFWKEKQVSGKRLLLLIIVLIGISGAFTAGERMLLGVVEIENIGGQPMILLRNDGVSLINCGARPKMAAETVHTALSRWNTGALETVLCTTGDYKTQSGLSAVLSDCSVQRILLPSASGEVASILTSRSVDTYSREGTVTVSGSTVQLLSAGEEQFALRLVCKNFSLFSLCGVKTQNVLPVLENNQCAANILLVDDRIANDWNVLYEICQRVKPSQIVITTTGYSEHSESFAGIPVTQLRQETLQFRFLR